MEQLHNIHPYPCKFPSKVAEKYITSEATSILDPFCGSGTTVLEASKKNIKAYGLDCNPIATLISKSKLLKFNKKFINDEIDLLNDYFSFEYKNLEKLNLKDFDGKDHWFKKSVQEDIEIIKYFISTRKSKNVTILYNTILSSLINKYGNQDSETRYVSVDKKYVKYSMIKEFINKSKKYLELYSSIKIQMNNLKNIHTVDIKSKVPLEDNSIDLVITSPPYANTMDYYLYHKQRMNILNFDFKEVQNNEIGSRHEYSSKKVPKEQWQKDFTETLSNISKKVKKGGKLIFVMGDSQIAKEKIDASKLVQTSAKEIALKYKLLESYPMAGRSRYFNASYQAKNKFEHIIQLSK